MLVETGSARGAMKSKWRFGILWAMRDWKIPVKRQRLS